MGAIEAIIIILIGFYVYFCPTIIAFNRKIGSSTTIMLLNIFFGWTIILWLVLLIIAFCAQRDTP
jgi:hypothetical protein